MTHQTNQKYKTMTLANYQSTVFVKVSETEILEMTYENYLLTYWRDHGALKQEIKEVEPDDIEGDVIYRVVTRWRSTGQIHSTDDFWTREEAELMILNGLEIDCGIANNDTPKAFFSREVAIA